MIFNHHCQYKGSSWSPWKCIQMGSSVCRLFPFNLSLCLISTGKRQFALCPDQVPHVPIEWMQLGDADYQRLWLWHLRISTMNSPVPTRKGGSQDREGRCCICGWSSSFWVVLPPLWSLNLPLLCFTEVGVLHPVLRMGSPPSMWADSDNSRLSP